MARRSARKASAQEAPSPAAIPMVEFSPIDQVIPYARNAKQHPPEQIEQIAASMREFGWTIPALIDEDGGLIAGHGRVLAARKIYDAGERLTMASGEAIPVGFVPLLRAVGWSEAKRRAYVIADNKIGENGVWDNQMLKLELGDLQGMGFDLALTGFGSLELGSIFAEANNGNTDPDDVPEPPANPVTRPGDVWLLGAKVRCPKCRKEMRLEDAVVR